MKNESFKITYSAEQQKEIEDIRKRYTKPEVTKLQQLRDLDNGVVRKATIFSIAAGTIGTLILGGGMSLIMTDIGAVLGSIAYLIGLPVGILGLLLLACAYPLYNYILKKERARIAPEILRLSDELMQITPEEQQ